MNKILSVMAVCLLGMLAVTSCDEQEAVSPASDTQLLGEAASPGLGCTSTDIINGTNAVPPGPALGDYCIWGRETFTLCGGGPQLSLEGQFNSFIRPLTAGWFVGDTPLNQFNRHYNQMSITPKAGNEGTAPNVTCFFPDVFAATVDNVSGVEGQPLIGPPLNYGRGYYQYDPATNTPSVIRVVVLWRGGTSSASNPVGAAEAYAIRVTSLEAIAGIGGVFNSRVTLDQRRVL